MLEHVRVRAHACAYKQVRSMHVGKFVCRSIDQVCFNNVIDACSKASDANSIVEGLEAALLHCHRPGMQRAQNTGCGAWQKARVRKCHSVCFYPCRPLVEEARILSPTLRQHANLSLLLRRLRTEKG